MHKLLPKERPKGRYFECVVRLNLLPKTARHSHTVQKLLNNLRMFPIGDEKKARDLKFIYFFELLQMGVKVFDLF